MSAVCSAPPRRSWRERPGPHSRYGARRTQALSALGNILGSLISLRIQPGADDLLWDYSGWRVLFFVGILPSVLVVPMLLTLREPGSGGVLKREQVARRAENVGSVTDLFRSPKWRRNTVVGPMLGVSGMIGLWGIGFFSPELISTALAGAPRNNRHGARLGHRAAGRRCVFGMIAFTAVASLISRRVAFLFAFLAAMITTAFVFNSLTTATDAYWMLPMMGFAQLALFAGYSIYFPELFPTRLRGTGVGFCYNTVR